MANVGSFTIATIRRQLKPRINDAAYNDSPLLQFLKSNDCINFGVGGDGFQSRARNSTSAIGGSTDDFSIRMLRTTQPFTGSITRSYVKYVWNLMISLLQDMRNQNAGNEAQMFKMRMQQVNEVCQSAISRVVTHMFTGNTVLYTNDDSTPMDGLADIISASNTYAGIDRTQTANAFWRSQIATVAKFTADTGNIGVNDGVRAMRAMKIACSLGKQTDMNNISKDLATGKDIPDGIITDPTSLQAYGDSLASQQRYAKASDANSSRKDEFEVFGGIEFTFDPFCPVGKMYFLNSRQMSLDIVGKDLFNQIFDGVIPIPYTAQVFTLATQGQFYSDNPRYLGLLNVTAY